MRSIDVADGLDAFDPNNWKPAEREFRVWLDDREILYVLVDEEDYQWAIQWKWKPIQSRSKHIQYAARSSSLYEQGVRVACVTYFLHVEIMKRTKKRRPSAKHVIVDHKDGTSLNCRRYNLRYATPLMNRMNIGGKAAGKQFFEDDTDAGPDSYLDRASAAAAVGG